MDLERQTLEVLSPNGLLLIQKSISILYEKKTIKEKDNQARILLETYPIKESNYEARADMCNDHDDVFHFSWTITMQSCLSWYFRLPLPCETRILRTFYVYTSGV